MRLSGSGSRWTRRASCCWRSTSASRTLALAQHLVHHVVQVLAPDCAPLFLTDGFCEYHDGLVDALWVSGYSHHAGGHEAPCRSHAGCRGPRLLYAQVVKTVRRRRLVRVNTPCGVRDPGGRRAGTGGYVAGRSRQPLWSASIWPSGSRWQQWGAGSRTLCKGEDGLRQQLVLYQAYHNFCLPHVELAPAVDRRPIPTNGAGSAQLWRPYTPAMAAGLTDHVWSLTRGVCSIGCRRGPSRRWPKETV